MNEKMKLLSGMTANKEEEIKILNAELEEKQQKMKELLSMEGDHTDEISVAQKEINKSVAEIKAVEHIHGKMNYYQDIHDMIVVLIKNIEMHPNTILYRSMLSETTTQRELEINIRKILKHMNKRLNKIQQMFGIDMKSVNEYERIANLISANIVRLSVNNRLEKEGIEVNAENRQKFVEEHKDIVTNTILSVETILINSIDNMVSVPDTATAARNAVRLLMMGGVLTDPRGDIFIKYIVDNIAVPDVKFDSVLGYKCSIDNSVFKLNISENVILSPFNIDVNEFVEFKSVDDLTDDIKDDDVVIEEVDEKKVIDIINTDDIEDADIVGDVNE